MKAALRARATELGFSLFGVAGVGPFPEHEHFARWIEKGHDAGMEYLKRRAAERTDLKRYFPEAKRVLCFGFVYARSEQATQPLEAPHVALYARGRDYHVVMEERLNALASYLVNAGGKVRVCVDTAPILERVYAHHAGLGWIGKNTCLLNREEGSLFFLGEILTDLDLPLDEPASAHCGSCTRCLDACPTQAFSAPYMLDARRCISYWTIEHRGPIPEDLQPSIGEHFFGCDICQQVCPWNHHPIGPLDESLAPLRSNQDFFEETLSATNETFSHIFSQSPLQRARWLGLIRNAVLVISNQGWKQYQNALEKLRNTLPAQEIALRKQIEDTLTRLHS